LVIINPSVQGDEDTKDDLIAVMRDRVMRPADPILRIRTYTINQFDILCDY